MNNVAPYENNSLYHTYVNYYLHKYDIMNYFHKEQHCGLSLICYYRYKELEKIGLA